MVEYTDRIDTIFSALSDPIRRDIIDRTSGSTLTVNQIAIEYDISLAATSKHLKVLSDAELIDKKKDGRFIYVTARPSGMRDAALYIKQYERAWADTEEYDVISGISR